jgi:hypothetical protein
MWGRGAALVVGVILVSAGCGEGWDRTGESAEHQTAAILSQRDTPLDLPSTEGLRAIRGVRPTDTGPLRSLALADLRGLRDVLRTPPGDPPPHRKTPHRETPHQQAPRHETPHQGVPRHYRPWLFRPWPYRPWPDRPGPGRPGVGGPARPGPVGRRPSPQPGRPVLVPPSPVPGRPSPVPLPIVTGKTLTPDP